MPIITDASVLRQVSTVVDITESIKIEFIDKLLEEMKGPNALGLALPQLGVFKRVFAARRHCNPLHIY